jgi:Flp pilus assembly protein TadG
MTHTETHPAIRDQSGAALVEFALLLPILMLLLLGMLDLGKAFNYWIDETHLAHEGARFAAVGKNPGPGATLQESLKQRANTAELEGRLQVCVSYPNGAIVGEPVEVSVTSTYPFLTFVANKLGVAQKTITATSTMRLERPATIAAACT